MRNIGLDVLRFFSVFLVLGRHIDKELLNHSFLIVWQRGGYVGVDLFFVLSGYLISTLIFKEYERTGDFNAVRFLIRRGFKIYPAFWLVLFVSIIFGILTKQRPTNAQIFYELFFVQNYHLPLFLGFSWSLAVEEHFYLLFSAICYGLKKLKCENVFRSIPRIVFVISLTCLLFRFINYNEYMNSTFLGEYTLRTHCRIDSIFFGVLLGYLIYYKDLGMKLRRIPSSLFCFLALVLLSPAFIYPLEEPNRWLALWGPILFCLAAGMLVISAIRTERSQNHVVKLFAALGGASYSIYLWHITVISRGVPLLKKTIGFSNPVIVLSTYIVGALAFGWLMNRIVEMPMLKLRDYCFKEKTKIQVKRNFDCVDVELHPEV